MAVQLQAGRNGGRMVSEINVTPLVDVMLVLLIIFMVAAPMMIQGVDVELPSATARPIPRSAERIVVSVTSTGETYVDNTQVNMDNLGAAVSTMIQNSPASRGVILKADHKVEYGVVAKVMAVLREAGIVQVGMVTEPGNSIVRNLPQQLKAGA